MYSVETLIPKRDRLEFVSLCALCSVNIQDDSCVQTKKRVFTKDRKKTNGL